MAYVPAFEYDVFISYAVADNDKPDQHSAGWVDVFERQLRAEIQKEVRHKAEVKIWRDTSRISCGDKFSDSIADGIRQSAVMIVLLSKQYLASEWCTEERAAFFRAIAADPHADHQRFFIVSLTDPKRLDALPDGLSEIHRESFWREKGGRPVLIGHPVPDSRKTDHQEFFDVTLRVAYDIAERLDELRQEVAQHAAPGVVRPQTATPTPALASISSGRFVSVATARKSTAEATLTADLVKALQSSVPTVPTVLLDQLPSDAEALRQHIKSAKLLVQVIGNNAPPRDGLQTNLAAEEQVPVLIWKADEVVEDPAEPFTKNHKALLERARKGSLEEAVRAVTEQWQKLNQPAQPKAPMSVNRKYLINHLPEDRELAGRVFKWLSQRQLPCVKRPLDGATEAELRTYFERKLIECGDMVLVYGRASRLSMNDEAELCYQVLATKGDLRGRAAVWFVVSGPPQPLDSQPELDVGLPGVEMRTVDVRGANDVELEAALEAAFGPAIGGQS